MIPKAGVLEFRPTHIGFLRLWRKWLMILVLLVVIAYSPNERGVAYSPSSSPTTGPSDQTRPPLTGLQPQAIKPFASLFSPTGITTDSDGNVIIMWVSGFNQVITRFAHDGTPLNSVNLTNQIGSSSMVFDTTNRQGILLFSTGDLLVFDPSTLQFTPWFNLRASAAAIDTSHIYDIATQTFGPMAGLIQPQIAQYGDLALYRQGDQLDLFVTGISSVFPFVLRIHLPGGKAQPEMKVILASSATAAPGNNLPRGITINHQGIALTTLPINQTTNIDIAVAFSHTFPDDNSLPFLPLGTHNFTSRGMAVDTSGDFFVSTGVIGTSLCGVGGSGAVVIFNPRLNDGLCENFGAILTNGRDVAVSPDGKTAYLTTSGLVYQFDVPSIPIILLTYLPAIEK